MVEEKKLIEKTKIELENILIDLGIDISPKEEFVEKYKDYKINWYEYTKSVDEELFLEN